MKYRSLLIVSLLTPSIAFAAPQTFRDLVVRLIDTFIDPLVPLLISVGLIVFLWGMIKYITAGGTGDEGKISQGRDMMIYGVIGLFVMTSVWGLVHIVLRTFVGSF
jgi:hypothetical protein